jgi:IMP dehydrogenase
MGSVKAMTKGSAARYGQQYKEGEATKLVPEGVEGLVEFRGTLEHHLHQLLGGLRSGLAYLGAANLKQLDEKARFIRITPASMVESHPHTITFTKAST